MKLVVTKANTLNAFTWIKQAWRLFTLQPGPFMAMSAIIITFTLLANVNAIFGIIVVFMMPFLSAGLYQCASRAEQGEKISAEDLFHYFSHIATHRVFIRLAFVSIVLSLPISHIAVGIQEQLVAGQVADLMSASIVLFLLWINFMLLAFAIPAAWIAPETDILTLMKQSFQACWLNVMPLTLYGLLILALVLVSLPILVVGWLIMYSISALSFYQMFLSIYQPESPVGDDLNKSELTSSSNDEVETETSESETKNISTDELEPKDNRDEQVSETDPTDNGPR